jgi:hypothetical protein
VTGNGTDAENMSIQAMEARKRILGPEDNDTLRSKEMVTLSYKLNHNWAAAHS